MVSFLGDADCFLATVFVAALAVGLVVAFVVAFVVALATGLGATFLASAFTGFALAALLTADLPTAAFLAAGLTVVLAGFAAEAATDLFWVVV